MNRSSTPDILTSPYLPYTTVTVPDGVVRPLGLVSQGIEPGIAQGALVGLIR